VREIAATAVRRVRACLVRDHHDGSIPVRGGPYDGQRVREIVTTDRGDWVLERGYLCRPVDRRGTPQSQLPYVLRDGVYEWNEGRSMS